MNLISKKTYKKQLMTQDLKSHDSEVQVRRFEKEGVEKCIVTYDNSTETFELTEAESNQPYQFDNVDIVAMEIYDLIQ